MDTITEVLDLVQRCELRLAGIHLGSVGATVEMRNINPKRPSFDEDARVTVGARRISDGSGRAG
jgi:hypothetical protein